MPSETEFISAVKVAFENAIVSEPFIRNLPVQSLLQKSGEAASQAGGDREWREKKTLFAKLLPSGHLTRLTIEAQKEDSTPEAINGMLLSVVQDRSLGKRKLMDLVEWLDCYYPAISNTLRQVCECEIPDTRFSNKRKFIRFLYLIVARRTLDDVQRTTYIRDSCKLSVVRLHSFILCVFWSG